MQKYTKKNTPLAENKSRKEKREIKAYVKNWWFRQRALNWSIAIERLVRVFNGLELYRYFNPMMRSNHSVCRTSSRRIRWHWSPLILHHVNQISLKIQALQKIILPSPEKKKISIHVCKCIDCHFQVDTINYENY